MDCPMPLRLLPLGLCASVAELVDAVDSKSTARKGMGVQVPPEAPPLCVAGSKRISNYLGTWAKALCCRWVHFLVF